MRPTPRYDGPPVIDLSDLGFGVAPMIRQRARLTQELSDLSADDWAAASRCEGWSVQDVAEHLVGVNQFWLMSIRAGLRGEPTRLLVTFDPVAVPAAMVEAARGAPPEATLEKLAATNAELADLVGSASATDLDKPAEAPPGHLPITTVCAHALWDAWVHERDMLAPLRHEPPVEPDEVAMALAYVSALGPACYVNAGESRPASLAVKARDPAVELSVHVSRDVLVRSGTNGASAVAVEGSAAELVEMLSCRRPQPEVDETHRWLVDGLSKLFNPAV